MDWDMEWDLWGPPYNQVAQESGYMQNGWQCDYYFGYGFDTIEENALNEKYCVQVLRILVVNADTEIDELEKDLISLQSELAWFENEEWSEICCNALQKRIDCLDISIRNLRDKDENDLDVHLLLHTQPAESLHEIVKVLLKTYCQRKDGEPADVSVLDPSFNSAGNAADLDKSTKLSNVDSNISVKEKIEGASNTTIENCTIVTSSQKLPLKMANDPDTAKPADIPVLDSSSCSTGHSADHLDEQPADIPGLDSGYNCTGNAADPLDDAKLRNVNSNSIVKEEVKLSDSATEKSCVILNSSLECQENKANDPDTVKLVNGTNPLKLATGHSYEKNESSKSVLICTGDGGTREFDSSSTDKNTIRNLSLKSVDKRRHGLNMVKYEPQNDRGKDASLNAHKHASGGSNEKRKSCGYDLSVKGNGEREYFATAMGKSRISNSAVNPEGKANFPEANQPQSDTDKDPSLIASKHARHSNEMKKSCKSDLKVKGNKGVREYCCAASGKSTISKSSVDPKGKDNVPKADKLATVVENVSPRALRYVTGLYGNRNNSDSGLTAFQQAKVGHSDMEQRLCEFASKASHKWRIKESRVGQNDQIHSLISFPKAQGKQKNSLQLVGSEEAGLTDTESSVFTPLLELQDSSKEDTTNLQPENFNFNLSLKPQKQKGKSNIKSDSSSTQDSLMEIIRSSSSISKVKREQKSGSGFDISSLSQSLGKAIKNSVHHPNEAKECIAASDDNQISFLRLQKKRKNSSASPIPLAIEYPTVKMSSSKSQGGPIDCPDEVLSITNSYSNDDSCIDAVASLPLKRIWLEKLPMCDLKAIAKQFKLPNLHKLRKGALVEKLADQLNLNSPSVQEPAFPSMEIVLSLSSISKAKRQQESGTGFDITSLSQTLEKNPTKKSVHLTCKAKDHIVASDDCHVSLLQLKRKRKKNSVSPNPLAIENSALKIDFSKSNGEFDSSLGSFHH